MELLRTLRSIKSLEVLTISNNPLTTDTEYKNYIFANLPKLKYLDYVYIDESIKSGADDYKYQADFNNYYENLEKTQKEEIINFHNDEIMNKMIEYKLINYDKYLLSGNEDLDELLNIKSAFEESTQKLNENIKNLIENIKLKMSEIVQLKIEKKEQFEEAFNKMKIQNEMESLEMIRIYQSEKKKLKRIIEETKSDEKKDKIDEILERLIFIEERLVDKEMVLNNRLKKSYTKLDSKLKVIYNDLEICITGDTGIKNVEEFISNFFIKFVEEALIEAERFEKFYYVNGSQNSLLNEEDVPWNDYQQSLLDSPDELKNSINTIKEEIENKHRSVDSLIRKDILIERQNYLSKIFKQIKKLNRKNIFNIIQLIEEEKKFWVEKKNSLNEDK